MILASLLLFALWLWQLTNCLRRESLPPLFGSARTARVLWLLSFLLLDPLQVLLYILFVRVGFLGKHGNSRLRSVLVPACLLFITALQFGWIGVERDVRFVATGGETPCEASLSAKMTAVQLRTTTTKTTIDSGLPFALGRLRVVAATDHPLVAQSARAIARELAALPFVDEVEYLPVGSVPEEGAAAPDMVLVLEADLRTDIPTMIFTRLRGTVRYSLNPSPPPAPSRAALDDRVATGAIKVTGTLELDFERAGFALGSERYGDPADSVRGWIVDYVSEALREIHAGQGTLPNDDIGFDYAAGPVPEALVRRGAEQQGSEAPRFQHHRTRWRFQPGPDTGDVLAQLEADLEAEGWHAERAGDGELSMRRGEEYLDAQRLGADYIAVHGALFSDAELDRVVEQMFERGVDPRWMTVFSERLTPAQAELLLTQLAERSPASPLEWVRIADVARAIGADERENQAIKNALVLVSLGFDDGVQRGTLTMRLEDAPSELDAVDLAAAAAAGLTPIEPGADILREIELGRAVRFVMPWPDGELGTLQLILEESPDGELALAYRIARGGGTASSTLALSEGSDGSYSLQGPMMSYGVDLEVSLEPMDNDRLGVRVRLLD